MIKWTAFALVLGFFIDLLVGDPRWLYHPVRIIGHGISFLEKYLRKCFPDTEKGQQRAGFVLVLLICVGSAGIPFGILYLAYKIHVVLGVCLETVMCYQMLAVKSLKDESMRVFEELKKVDFEGAKVLHLTGIPPALSQSCRNATYRMIERARENAMIVTFDPNLRPTLWESKSVMIRTINDLASRADIVLPGTGEGKVLMGSEDPKEIASFYRRLGAKAVIVKAGAEGAYVEMEDQKRSYPGFKVDKVIDTVGAGDGFAVGVISSYLEGLSTEQMIERANAIGSIQVSVESDNEGLPTREELRTYIETHQNER